MFNHHNKTQGGQTFQIPLAISVKLHEYAEKVQEGNFLFPEFFLCPLCGKAGCAVRIGYYYRNAVDFDPVSGLYANITVPVARFMCRNTETKKNPHRTFSLLPENIIPYNRISIDFMMYILALYFLKYSFRDVFNEIDFNTDAHILISEKTIIHLNRILRQSHIKLINYFQKYPGIHSPPDFYAYSEKDFFYYLCEYSMSENNLHLTEAERVRAIARLYYETSGGYSANAHFLFGTASQLCI